VRADPKREQICYSVADGSIVSSFSSGGMHEERKIVACIVVPKFIFLTARERSIGTLKALK